ncbi:basic-leucine zipper transcription factor A [Drosophila ficusphila]|uniref:basic-leucine zipper transcription factor A n=1 Tax=Drosophila ficusphila TaxID=30025 RepID=UPI0007E80B22|nr:basic-leucine zipper transcription factor A [Drosophila ficusphila]
MELPMGKFPGFVYQVLLLQLLLLVSPAMLQQQHVFYHPRPLFYDAPRLRRFEYAAATPFVGGYNPASASPALHYQQQTPNFQLINYRPSYQPLALDYQQQQLPAPAPPLPPLFPQQSVQYQQRTIAPHAELAKYRYEGNYLPVQRVSLQQPQRRAEEQQQLQQQHLQQQHLQQQHLQHQQQQQQQQLYNVPPALFTSDVLHVIPPRIARLQEQQQQPSQNVQTERPRRYAKDQDTDVAETKSHIDRSAKETKYFHDIFMRFDGPNSRSHGHVLKHPKAQEKRFESQRGTNRYKGEVIWTDRQGGHGEHRWDLAQGKL